MTLLPAIFVSPANAALEEDMWIIYIYGGLYKPGPDNILDDEPAFGARVFHTFTETAGIMGTLGRTSFDETITSGPFMGTMIDLDLTLVDASFVYSFMPKRRFSPSVFGGVGGAFGSASGTIMGPMSGIIFSDLDDSSLTINAGIGTTAQFTDRFFMRLQSMWRFFENRENDETDQETSLNFGWRLGGP